MSEEFKGRREDFRLVTGQGKYTADWNLPGQLHGAFLRSDRAHAEIVSLDVERALAVSGVVAVLTGADTARANLKAAGLLDAVALKQADVLEIKPPAGEGILVTNPPYGVRLGDKEQLAAFIEGALSRGFAFTTTGEFAKSLDRASIPVRELVRREMPGRSGVVSTQGD